MNLDLKYSPIDVLSSYKDPTHFNENRIATNASNTLSINELSYLPATLIIIVAHWVPLPATLVFQLGRLFNFIIAGILYYLAIKNTPCFKRIFFMIALFPITLQQSAAVNQDWLINAVIFLFTALTFQFAFSSPEVSKGDYIVMLILSGCIGMVKMVYFPILLLTFLIPTQKFQSVGTVFWVKEGHSSVSSISSARSNCSTGKNMSAWIFKLSVILLGFLLGALQALSIYMGAEQHLVDVNFFTLSMLLENPLKALLISWNTLNERATLDFCDGLLNGFGWSIKWTSGVARSLIMMAALFLVFTNREENISLKFWHKILIFGSMIGMWGMVYVSLLTSWTDAGSSTIDGLQPRYFIPVILLMYILFANPTFQNMSKRINGWFCAFAVIALTIGMWTLACGYYQL